MSLSLIAPICCRNHAIKSVLDNFFIQVEIRKHQFLCAIFGTKFERNDLNLRIKSVKLKKNPFKIATGVNFKFKYLYRRQYRVEIEL